MAVSKAWPAGAACAISTPSIWHSIMPSPSAPRVPHERRHPPTTPPAPGEASAILHESLRIDGNEIACERRIEVRHPYTGKVVATIPKASVEQVRQAFST